MSLVGDIILELRARIPDAPATNNPCLLLGATGANVPGGGMTPGDYVIGATNTNWWGETHSGGGPTGGLVTCTVGPNQNVILVTIADFIGVPTQITGINVYVAGNFANILTQGTAGLVSFPALNGTNDYVVGLAGQPSVHSLMPTRNTAFLPDADGNFIGGYMAYRLLNRAIAEMVKIAGGIIDVTGVQTQINQSMYRLDGPNGQGSFYGFTNAWYDGYPMDVVPRSMMYLRNSAAGFSGILSYEQDGPQSVIQVWPQSNRTGGQTYLSGQVEADANGFVAHDASGFLSIGLCQIDDEIMAYSRIQPTPPPVVQSQFFGVTRGLSGTTPAIHQADAIVTELNLRMSGYRMPPVYQVGDSYKTLMVPQAWETPLVLHMLSQVRSMEQDDAASKSLLADFQQQADKIAKQSRMGKLKPRQIGIWGQNVSDARNVNGIGFGWLIN
jgi:hypothetical protein